MQPGLEALALFYGWSLCWVWGNGGHQSQLQYSSSKENLGVNTFYVDICEASI